MIWDEEHSKSGYLRMAKLTSGTFPNGTWTQISSTQMPMLNKLDPIGTKQPVKAQPLLTENEFCFRNEALSSIDCYSYNGQDPTLASSYSSSPTIQVAGTNFVDKYQGDVVSVAEPSIFTFNGQNCMSFSLAEYAGFDSAYNVDSNYDLGVAWVCE